MDFFAAGFFAAGFATAAFFAAVVFFVTAGFFAAGFFVVFVSAMNRLSWRCATVSALRERALLLDGLASIIGSHAARRNKLPCGT
ncbi:MAG: hypothetical protein R3A48_02740 [Polyangiales bacterium]